MKNISIAGRLTRDAKLNRTQAGDPVLSFTVAVDGWNGKEKVAEFFDCSYWGNRAVAIETHMVKGKVVSACGDLGRKEHEGRTYLTVRVNEVEMHGGGKSADAEPAPRSPPANFSDAMSDDIPFAMEWR